MHIVCMIHANQEVRIQVICGSVRPGRICPDVARWVMEACPAEAPFTLDLVDLADWPLPMGAEPGIPARDPYARETTRTWSRKIAEAAGHVFVTPQYNWGYPAALKNALDHLYREWSGKPAAIVSYGFRGGGKCAAQLREVLEGLHMRPVDTMPALVLPEAMKGGAALDPQTVFAPARADVTRAFREIAAMLARAAYSAG
jgi:NAD(P)H-dependent FMN reductase